MDPGTGEDLETLSYSHDLRGNFTSCVICWIRGQSLREIGHFSLDTVVVPLIIAIATSVGVHCSIRFTGRKEILY